MTEQWLSIVEYARTFKLSDMTVRRRIKTGKLHAILQDGKYFIPLTGAGAGSVLAVPAVAPGGAEPRRQPEARGYPEPTATPTFAAPRQSHAVPHPSLVGSQPTHAALRPQHSAPLHSELVVVKGHTIAVKPTHQVSYRGEDVSSDADNGTIPSSLRRPLAAQEASLVDTRALLAYCEASLRKVSDNERRTVEKFKCKLEALEAVVANRDLELKALRQQVEDLQLLVKILERRKQPA